MVRCTPVKGDLRDFRTAVAHPQGSGHHPRASMTNNPEKVKILAEYGIEVVECVGVVSQDPTLRDFYDYKGPTRLVTPPADEGRFSNPLHGADHSLSTNNVHQLAKTRKPSSQNRSDYDKQNAGLAAGCERHTQFQPSSRTLAEQTMATRSTQAVLGPAGWTLAR